MEQNKLDQLQDEIRMSARAESFYNEFVKPFVKANKERFYEAFENTSLNDKDQIVELRRMVLTLNKFEDGIKEYITTGKMAAITLEQEIEND